MKRILLLCICSLFAVTAALAIDTSETTPVPIRSCIYRDNGHYLYNDVYISEKEVVRILERETPGAYKHWKKGSGMLIGGAVCIGVGGGMVLGGLIPLAYKMYTTCIGLECAAIVPLGIGLGLTLGARAEFNKAIDIYNSRCGHQTAELQLHVAPTELGIALAF